MSSINLTPEWNRNDDSDKPQLKSAWTAGKPNLNAASPPKASFAQAVVRPNPMIAVNKPYLPKKNTPVAPHMVIPPVPTDNGKSKPFRYTQEFLLSLKRDDLKPPGSFDHELAVELTQVWESSYQKAQEDHKNRSHYNKNDRGRHFHRGGYHERGGHRASREPSSKELEEVHADDLWDTPTTMGAFGADGVFAFGTDMSKAAMIEAERLAEHAKFKVDKSPLMAKQPLVPGGFLDEPGISPALTHSRLNSESPKMPLNNFGLNPLPRSPNPALNAELFNPPPFQFVPPQWVYQDPQGNQQGPFTSETMHAWFKDGYFPRHLPIKCIGDPAFIPLYLFVEKYGTEAPFLESLIEQEQLEKTFYLQQVDRMRAALRPTPQPLNVGLNPLTSPILSPGHRLSSGIESAKPPLAFEEETSTKSPISPPLLSPPTKVVEQIKNLALNDKQVSPSDSPSSAVAPWAAMTREKSQDQVKLKDIQESEQKKAMVQKQELEKEQHRKLLLEAQRLRQEESLNQQPAIAPQSTWGSKAVNTTQKKTLAEIMKDEAELKQGQQKPAVGKRYADTVGKVASNSGNASTVVATGPVLKPTLNDNGWQVAGKNLPPKATKPNGAQTKQSQQTLAVIEWAKATLRDAQKASPNAPLNVDEFVGILMSISVKESGTIGMICDDALGGFTSIQSRKFAEEFIRRRSAANQNHPQQQRSPVPEALAQFTDDNKFVMVKGGKKKNKKK